MYLSIAFVTNSWSRAHASTNLLKMGCSCMASSYTLAGNGDGNKANGACVTTGTFGSLETLGGARTTRPLAKAQSIAL